MPGLISLLLLLKASIKLNQVFAYQRKISIWYFCFWNLRDSKMIISRSCQFEEVGFQSPLFPRKIRLWKISMLFICSLPLFLGILNHEYGDFSMRMRVVISSSFLFLFFCYSFILVFLLFLCFLLFLSLLITFSFMLCGASIIPEPSFHCWSCDRNTISRLLYDIDLHHCWEMMRSVGILLYLVTTICFSVEGVSVTVTP